MPCKKAKKALKNLGFEEQTGKGTSHKQYKKIVNGRMFKVTLDCHKGEVLADNVKSMASQAGVSKNEFWKASEK